MNATERLRAEAARRILIKDGPYGTAIQARALDEKAFRGGREFARDQRGNNDLLNLTQPEIVREICESYLAAGADIVATNTFSANRISQADYGAESLSRDINIAAARITRGAVDAAMAIDPRPRFVAGAVGPTNKTLSLSPDVNDPGFREIDFDTMKQVYAEQIGGLLDGGCDFILIETVFDTLNAKAAIMAVLEEGDRRGATIPLMLSMTITDRSGRNLSGHSIEAFWYAVRHARPVSVGLNCSFGADLLRPHVQALDPIADTLIMAYPNAGLPNDLGEYDETPAATSRQLDEWARDGLLNIVGGCCGTTPEHIEAIAAAMRAHPPRATPVLPSAMRLAGLEPMTLVA